MQFMFSTVTSLFSFGFNLTKVKRHKKSQPQLNVHTINTYMLHVNTVPAHTSDEKKNPLSNIYKINNIPFYIITILLVLFAFIAKMGMNERERFEVNRMFHALNRDRELRVNQIRWLTHIRITNVVISHLILSIYRLNASHTRFIFPSCSTLLRHCRFLMFFA